MDELERIVMDGVSAHERFVAESKAIDYAWKTGTLADLVNQMKERAIYEYSRTDPRAAAGPVS